MNADEQVYDREAEVALLSACMWSKQARQVARKHLLPGDFYTPTSEAVFDTMVALDREGTAVDQVTLRAALVAGKRVPERNVNQVVLDVMTGHGVPEAVADYAAIVRGWALRRRIADAAARVRQQAMNPSETPARLASEAVTAFTGLRDSGTDTTATPLSALMAVDDVEDTPEWVIPDLMERGDRLMLSGTEGAGKSALSRQLAVCSAAGIHPFTSAVMPPIKALVVDCENKPAQVRRQTRPLLDWLRHHAPGSQDPTDRVLIDTPGRISLLRDRDLSRIHQTIDAWQPDLVIIGPTYRMSDRALNDDSDAAPFLAALDTIIARGCAMVLEAHAGHGTEGVGKAQRRSLRPRGSSALLGWPEFGLGLRALGGGIADLEPWRGGRELRAWPTRVKRSPGNRWLETYPDDRPPPEDPAAEPVGQQTAMAL